MSTMTADLTVTVNIDNEGHNADLNGNGVANAVADLLDSLGVVGGEVVVTM